MLVECIYSFFFLADAAAQVLDLDNEHSMKSETIKGDVQAWKKLPKFLIKLAIENPFLFDFLKYETMRAEIDYYTSSSTACVLWENKVRIPDLRKLGLLNGIMSESVNQM